MISHNSVKRNDHHFDMELESPQPENRKRIKICQRPNSPTLSIETHNPHHQQKQYASYNDQVKDYMTPIQTPLMCSKNSPQLDEPYCEVEDYMLRGYYDDTESDNIQQNSHNSNNNKMHTQTINNNNIQYSLYDLTNEEIELSRNFMLCNDEMMEIDNQIVS